MTARQRLADLSNLPAGVRVPGYDLAAHGGGIVHIGVGAFHKAHQAVYTDDALAAAGGDWRITGISLRSTDVPDSLNPQHGLYTLLERGEPATVARVVGSIGRVIAAARDLEAALAAITHPGTRIVSLTVTEKAYGIDRQAGGVDPGHSAIAPDLANPRQPKGAIGLIVEGLRRRRDQGDRPFTVLCCDNLPENGALLGAGVADFARRIDPDLARWIADHVPFPATMVDRITPATTEATLRDAEALTGRVDLAAVETEPFSQWVIEDRFVGGPAGRPAWEAGGAIFAADVVPYERMKLRMLNGTHSMMAYAGFLAGRDYVRDVMADPFLAGLVDRHLRAAAGTLAPLPGIDFADYAAALAARFRNPAIAHETYQIAMDGTEKLPQRLLEPALFALEHGQSLRPFAFAVAAWMRYCTGRSDTGEPYALRDPRGAEIEQALAGVRAAEDMAASLLALPGLFPLALTENNGWRTEIVGILKIMVERGMAAAIETEARIRE